MACNRKGCKRARVMSRAPSARPEVSPSGDPPSHRDPEIESPNLPSLLRQAASTGTDDAALRAALSSRAALSHWLQSSGVQAVHSAMESLVCPESAGAARALVREALDRVFQDTAASAADLWVPAALATALPLLYQGLPRDQKGACVVPHPHPLVKCEAPKNSIMMTGTGVQMYETGRACDNCDGHITDQFFWKCSESCQVDFCRRCYAEMEELFKGRDPAHMEWVVRFIPACARGLLDARPEQRERFVQALARDWPAALFERLVSAVVDVADAGVVHIEDNADIASGTAFWDTVALMQMLYAANHRGSRSVFLAGPTLPSSAFVLHGIGKCEAFSDWQRWRSTPQDVDMYDLVVRADPFEVTPPFTCFLAHNNLVPVAFRRACLSYDTHAAPDLLHKPRFTSFKKVVVHRDPPERLRAGLIQTLGRGFATGTHVRLHGLTGAPELNGQVGRLKEWDPEAERWTVRLSVGLRRVRPQNLMHAGPARGGSDGAADGGDGPLADAAPDPVHIAQPLAVTFDGEVAQGQGVVREFLPLALQVALRADPAAPLWECAAESRAHWFGGAAAGPEAAAAFRACGAVLGHAILMDVFLPPAFPLQVYALLLRDLGSPCVGPWTLNDMAMLDPQMASGLEHLIEYEGPDVADVFPLDWPRAHELAELAPAARGDYVQRYVEWYFDERFAAQARPFCEGFRAVVGHSRLLRCLVSAEQLQQIICGAEQPLDVAAVRAGATFTGWGDPDQAYLEAFWGILEGLAPDERQRFVLFVSASSRMPLKGWGDFPLQLQKHGVGDERLPTAYTCFHLLLLPVYSSVAVLRARLLQAIQETQGFGLG